MSIDVVGLYSNIPTEEGLTCFRKALDTRKNKQIPTDLIVELMRLVLTLNIFEFNLKLFQQLWGTAMGTRPAPTFANLFMAEVDKKLLNVGQGHVYYCKRFIDDIFIIWTASEEEFKVFMEKINGLHETIKFTSSYEPKDRSTTFLDTKVSVVNNRIVTDLYRKPTDKVQYLLPSSNHPGHIFKNIPFSLALRLVRIVSERETLIQRMVELKLMLLSRKYNKNIVNAAINKALQLDRKETLKKVTRKPNERVVLAVTYNPKLPSVSSIVKKHWTTMTRDAKMLQTYPKPPMVAFKQPPNLKRVLVRAKLPAVKTRAPRVLLGVKPCNTPCAICPYVNLSKEVCSSVTNKKYMMTGQFNCSSKGLIYLTTCTHCKKQYVGQTGRTLRERIKEHLQNIHHKKEVTGLHYSLPGHSHWDLKVQVIEKVTPNTPSYRLEREDFWIKTLVTKTPNGLNKYD